MKFSIYIYLIAGLLLALISCQEEEKGPLVTFSGTPTPVSEVVVENLPGGAKISYRIPNDDAALLVEANYTRDNGEKVITKSSIYKNFVNIEGLRKQTPQTVELVTVDKSNNRSSPVSVTIEPLIAPIDRLFSTMKLIVDFGGVRLQYDNDDEVPTEILLYVGEGKDNLVYSQSAFINDGEKSHFTFRGYEPNTKTFGVTLIDRWDNSTDFLIEELEPLEEVLLDRTKFRDISLEGDEASAFGWVKSNLWNGSIDGSGFHTSQTTPGTIIPPYTEGYHMFTMDLGVEAKLSRFTFWQRPGWIYIHGNPRYFEVWGTDKFPDDNGASLEGWTKLIENGEVIKPSGGPLGNNSGDDIAAAARGEEFEIPIDAPPVRYIRFVNIRSWSSGKFMHLMEVNFHGKVEE